MSRRRLPLRVATVAAMVLLTAACADDPADTASDPEPDPPATSTPTSTGQSPTAPQLPPCTEVWVAGATLPRGYQGCEQDGEQVEADRHPCSYGAAIIEFDDRFYAVTGKQINEVPSLAESQQFDQALTACQA